MTLLPEAYLWSSNRSLNFGDDPDYNLELSAEVYMCDQFWV